MTQRSVRITAGVVCDRVGDDVVALLPDSTVVTITGHEAVVLGRLIDGDEVGEGDEGVSRLVEAGIITPVGVVSRRSVVTGGAVAASATIVTLALPSAAAASSLDADLTGTWNWLNVFAEELQLPENMRTGFQDPTWVRLFIVNLPEGFPPSMESPSSLTVGGQQFDAQRVDQADSSELAPFGDNLFLVFLNTPSTDAPQDKSEPLEGTLTGTFTWRGRTYVVPFTQTPDSPSESTEVE